MFCAQCGIEVPDDSVFCHNCGAAITETAGSAPPGPSRPTVRKARSPFHPAMVGVLLAAAVGIVVVVVIFAGPFGGGGSDVGTAPGIQPSETTERPPSTGQDEQAGQEADFDAEAEYCRKIEPFQEGPEIADVLQPTQAEREEVSSRLATLQDIQPPPRWAEFHRMLVEAYTMLDNALRPDAGLGAMLLVSSASLKLSTLWAEKPPGGPC